MVNWETSFSQEKVGNDETQHRAEWSSKRYTREYNCTPSPTVIGILLPLVAMSTKRSRAASWKMEAEVEKAIDILDGNFRFLWEVVA